ncbi:12686_t:CDS:2, partial [Entrophospora sp. SA101]
MRNLYSSTKSLSIDQEITTRSSSPTPLRSLDRLLITNNILNKPIHTIKLDDNSILSLACSNKYLFSGSQDFYIRVWDLITFQQAGVLKGHTGRVLCLSLSNDQSMLFSSSGDGTVRDTYQYQIYFTLKRFDLSIKETYQTPHLPNLRNYSKFFDSFRNNNGGNSNNNIEDGLIDEKINFIEDEQQGVKRFEICDDMIYHNSHNGYVYALVLGVNKDGDILISGQ